MVSPFIESVTNPGSDLDTVPSSANDSFIVFCSLSTINTFNVPCHRFIRFHYYLILTNPMTMKMTIYLDTTRCWLNWTRCWFKTWLKIQLLNRSFDGDNCNFYLSYQKTVVYTMSLIKTLTEKAAAGVEQLVMVMMVRRVRLLFKTSSFSLFSLTFLEQHFFQTGFHSTLFTTTIFSYSSGEKSTLTTLFASIVCAGSFNADVSTMGKRVVR